jgi:serine beta-lactamase-like protein LACTB, mitochondrial
LRASKRGRVEAAVAVLFAVVIVAAGGLALYIASTNNPIHDDPAAVPSVAADVDAGPYAEAVEKARRAARELIVAQEVPGLSVAVATDSRIVWAEGFGFAHLEKRVPVTPRTRFRTGSVSKTMTATALGLLLDRGRLDLDAPVQTYVPAYPRQQWRVTPRQLMGDLAGVHRIRDDQGDRPRGECTSLDQALKIFDTEPLLFEPGTQYRFSTYGWILLSAVVEGVAGEPFPAFMSREVFTPLGMDRTVLEGTPLRRSDRQGAADQDADDVSNLQGASKADYGCFFGAGGYVSTPSDLVRLGSAMLKPGLLTPQTIALLQTPLTLESGESTGFALGWGVDSIPLAGTPTRVVRHRASLIGSALSLSLFPDLGLAVAVSSSNQNIVAVDLIVPQIAEAFAD